MNDTMLTRINARIAAAEAEITAVTKQLEAAQERLRRLQITRDVLGEEEVDEDNDDVGETRRVWLADKIEMAIMGAGEPLEANEVFGRLVNSGHETTQATVNTTLSRMKVAERVVNDGGKWDVTAKRRRALSKSS
jgi:hypothetical protein